MIPLFPITSAGVEQPVSGWTLVDTITTDSSNSFFDVTVTPPASTTGRLIFNIVADGFTADQQIRYISVDSGATVFDFQSDSEGFEKVRIGGANLNDYLSAEADDAARTSTYNSLSFSAITTATSGNGLWLRDTGGTTSSNTGISTSSFYIYFEATGSSTSSPQGGIARSPEFSVDSSPSILITMGRFGGVFTNSSGTYGRLEIWWKVS